MKDTITYLVMVTPVDNHNKFYRMIPGVPDAAHFTAEYGRVGATGMKKIYTMDVFNRIYNEKLNKGYTDQTNLHQDVVTALTDMGYKAIENAVVARLVDSLRLFADDTIKNQYSVTSKDVTDAMIRSARGMIDELGAKHNVASFNRTLLELFTIIPRKMRKVEDYLASAPADFGEIITREEALLDVMSGQVTQSCRHSKYTAKNTRNGSDESRTILEENGLEIRPCNAEELDKIKCYLGAESSGKLKQAFYVKNTDTEKRFDEYCKTNKISRRDIHFLYHGSRNQNWWNILIQGLAIHPSKHVIRTGAMFGQGLYFAQRARKSIGYTSLSGSYWARGSSQTGFLSVYKVAYKNPYKVFSFENEFALFTKKDMDRLGTDAVFASKEKGMLVNDELIVYDEAQVTIRYLIELSDS